MMTVLKPVHELEAYVLASKPASLTDFRNGGNFACYMTIEIADPALMARRELDSSMVLCRRV